MSLKDLTVRQVRQELAKLITNYPDREGGVETADRECLSCVYYEDGEGRPVTLATYDREEADVFSLVTPVCIVGEWVESFHPELKQDPTFLEILVQNSIIADSVKATAVLSEEVRDLLALAQSQQDDGLTWGQIDLGNIGL